MKKFKVLKNGIETNAWLESETMGANHYEPCFGLPDRWVAESALTQEEINLALDVRETVAGHEYFFPKTYEVQIEEVMSFEQIEINNNALILLDSTDWYVTRFAETGQAIPQDIKDQRAAARQAIIR